jgi:hypothetical protein
MEVHSTYKKYRPVIREQLVDMDVNWENQLVHVYLLDEHVICALSQALVFSCGHFS